MGIPQPEYEDQETPQIPMTPEMIGHVLGTPERLLTNRHIKELQRRGKGITHEGYLIIEIKGGKVTKIGDVRFKLF